MMKTQASWMTMAVAIAMALAANLSAISPTPVPDVKLMTLQGQPSATAALPKDGQWLIVYVRPGCTPCNAFLGAATPKQPQPIGQRIVVVVASAEAETATKLAADRPELAQASWYLDAEGSLAKALDLHEAPVIMGVSGRTIQWSLAGVLSGGARTRSLMESWIR